MDKAKRIANVIFLCFVLLNLEYVSVTVGDTPANCTYEEVIGSWYFFESERSGDSSINCTIPGPTVYTLQMTLLFPDVVVDQYGNKGFWTVVYNQGFEIVINYRKYYAFSAYKNSHGNVTSMCDRTLPGWSHDVLGNNWACYVGKKITSLPPKHHVEKLMLEKTLHKTNFAFLHKINSKSSSWKARWYPEYDHLTISQLLKQRGGRKSHVNMPKAAPVTNGIKMLAAQLPEELDWRNINGVNYVSSVRNQGSCGSCYSFASLAMIESRLQIMTNNSVQVQLSPQDVISCSEYSQGCEGGFPYLVAGKYAQDFGLIPEKCNPYKGKDEPCSEKKCARYYTADYSYVGGFYGACNEELMRIQLVKNGPLAVGFEVYNDFMYYSSGIYHHTGLKDALNFFEETNHAVLLVGYGVSNGEKFWIVKNSWGSKWGEKGFFRIRRGTDECGFESMAVEATPIP